MVGTLAHTAVSKIKGRLPSVASHLLALYSGPRISSLAEARLHPRRKCAPTGTSINTSTRSSGSRGGMVARHLGNIIFLLLLLLLCILILLLVSQNMKSRSRAFFTLTLLLYSSITVFLCPGDGFVRIFASLCACVVCGCCCYSRSFIPYVRQAATRQRGAATFAGSIIGVSISYMDVRKQGIGLGPPRCLQAPVSRSLEHPPRRGPACPLPSQRANTFEEGSCSATTSIVRWCNRLVWVSQHEFS